jgi:outer membrane protein insertion porin family
VYDNSWDLSDIRQDVGIGFRWLSPMGPLRLEWAYVIDPRPGDDTSNWEFSIGGGF